MGVFDSVIPIRKRCSGVFFFCMVWDLIWGQSLAAAQNGHLEVVRLLVEAGAAANCALTTGCTPRDFFGVDDLGGGWVGPSGYL